MSSVVVGEHADFEAWLARRRAQGLDGRDEVWEGVYHVAPHEHSRNGLLMSQLIALLGRPAHDAGLVTGGAFNLGEHNDFRVPDLGYHRQPFEPVLYVPTAALVIEVLSPGDESEAKLPFYAAHGVDEVWFVDPLARTVVVRALCGTVYTVQQRSDLLGITAADLEQRLTWR